MSDRYLTFVARAEQGAKTWRVRTYGPPTDEQIEGLRDEVAMWAYPDEECSVRVLNEPILPGLHYEPVNGFLNCHLLTGVEKVLAYPQNPSATPPRTCPRCHGAGRYWAELPDSGDMGGTWVRCDHA